MHKHAVIQDNSIKFVAFFKAADLTEKRAAALGGKIERFREYQGN